MIDKAKIKKLLKDQLEQITILNKIVKVLLKEVEKTDKKNTKK